MSANFDTYLVIIDGEGEFGNDFTVLEVEALNPKDAVEKVTAPGMGYGRDEDGTALAVLASAVTFYTVNDTTKKTVGPSSHQAWRRSKE